MNSSAIRSAVTTSSSSAPSPRGEPPVASGTSAGPSAPSTRRSLENNGSSTPTAISNSRSATNAISSSSRSRQQQQQRHKNPSSNQTTAQTTRRQPSPQDQQQQQQRLDLRTNPRTTATSATRHPVPALAFSVTTPTWAKVLLPVLALVCHVIFYYGQTEPMWKLHANATIDVWANATSYSTRTFFESVGIPYENEFHIAQEEDVQTFTYGFAISELWQAKDLPGLVIPRLAAILLIVFSGVWPHVKLIMLNLTWFFGKHPIRRTRALQWLAGLGKWSLADVLVVCVMVGVLHLDWIVEPEEIKQGLIDDLPSLMQIVETLYTPEDLCNKILHMDCASKQSTYNKGKCKMCNLAVGTIYAHPGWAESTGRSILLGVDTNGGGVATLRVVGMRGIYAFCGAVILSIVLSLIVDIFDAKAKRVARQGVEEITGERAGLGDADRVIRRLIPEAGTGQNRRRTSSNSSGYSDQVGLEEPLLTDGSAISATNSLEIEVGLDDDGTGLGQWTRKHFSCQYLLLSGITGFLVFLAIDMFTMKRLVYGAGPQLLSDILSVNFQKTYSLRSLMWTTGAGGGWDNMLMGTFGLFCVVGPFVQAILLGVIVFLDQCKISISWLATTLSFLGSFCAWEVFSIAIVMVQMLMPTITGTIIQNPVCSQISTDGTCLTVEFNVIPYAFATMVLGWLFLMGLSWTASSRAAKHEEGRYILSSGSNAADGQQRGLAVLSRVMTPNHNYQRLPVVGEGRVDNLEWGVEELVFETNQV